MKTRMAKVAIAEVVPAWFDEELDEWECRAFNPDDQIGVTLPSGAVAHVARDVSPETLAALDRMASLMIAQFTGEAP